MCVVCVVVLGCILYTAQYCYTPYTYTSYTYTIISYTTYTLLYIHYIYTTPYTRPLLSTAIPPSSSSPPTTRLVSSNMTVDTGKMTLLTLLKVIYIKKLKLLMNLVKGLMSCKVEDFELK